MSKHLISIEIMRDTAERILEAIQNQKELELTSFDLNELHSALEQSIAEDDG